MGNENLNFEITLCDDLGIPVIMKCSTVKMHTRGVSFNEEK